MFLIRRIQCQMGQSIFQRRLIQAAGASVNLAIRGVRPGATGRRNPGPSLPGINSGGQGPLESYK
jgi:hypothetical protein